MPEELWLASVLEIEKEFEEFRKTKYEWFTFIILI